MGLPEVMAAIKESNPEVYAMLAPQEAAPPEEETNHSGVSDYVSKALSVAGDIIGDSASMAKLGAQNSPILKGIFGHTSSLLALPADVMTAYNGAKAYAEGDSTGAFDVTIGAAGVVSDVSGLIGKNPISDLAGFIQGSAEVGKGAGELATWANTGNADYGARGASDIMDGIADGLGSTPNPMVAMGGKALGMGLAMGNAIAPAFMGGEGDSAEVRQSDGDYVGSTGWCVTDWISGTGKYTDSRWHADGERVTNTPELTEADMENPYVKLAMQIAAND